MKGKRLQGKIARWDDDKGFGFVSWSGDGMSVFVHIKAFTKKSRRPVIGDIVSFELAKEKRGCPRAEATQRFLRHKSRKRVFLNVYWATVLQNLFGFGYLVWSGGEASFVDKLVVELWQNVASPATAD